MHELADAVESLTDWRGRARRLPWYRVAARREARELAQRWEARVTRAVVSERGLPLRVRLTAALAVAHVPFARVRVRRWLVRLAVLATTIVVAFFALLVIALEQIF